MILLGLFGSYLTILAAGFGLTLLMLSKPQRQLNILECSALAWLLGTGLVSLLLWTMGFLVSGIILQGLVTVICVGLSAFGWRAKRQATAFFTFPWPASWIEWILGALLVIEVITVLIVSCKHTLGWDGLLIWEAKARYAFLNSGTIPLNYYSDTGRAFSHPEYPLGIPFTELWLYLWMGEAHQFWVKTIFPTFYAAGSVLLTLIATRVSGRRWSGLLVALLLPFIPFVISSPGGVIVGYADIPLAVFYLAALGYLLVWLSSGELRFLLICLSCLSLLPWIKREGLILWCVLAVLGLWGSWRQQRLRTFAMLLFPSLLPIVFWRIYLGVAHVRFTSDFVTPSANALKENISRVIPICQLALAETSDYTQWSIFWLLVVIAIVYLIARWRSAQNQIIAASIVAPVVLYCAAYLFSNWPSYTAHITSSMPRLLLHVVPVGWLAIAAVIPCNSRHSSV
jgi:hypothetical protein